MSDKKSENLAKIYCSSCHLFPSPELLDKETWAKSVLPQMAFRMGFKEHRRLSDFGQEDALAILSSIPAQQMVSDGDWKLITEYYVSKGPDALSIPIKNVDDTLHLFRTLALSSIKLPFITLLKYDSGHQALYVGTRLGMLYKTNHTQKILDSTQLPSTPADLKIRANDMAVGLMGRMDPNDQVKGKLIQLSDNMKEQRQMLDSLKRPVFFEQADFDKDGIDDFVVCNFGNYTGGLIVYKGKPNGKFEKFVLYPLAGARKVFLNDFNNDGFVDVMALMAQGDEKLSIFYNHGKMDFNEKIILRFPPVYGSNYFETADFNGDGYLDILTTNGDNADFSMIQKPYHAVRIFQNDQKNNFKEVWTHAMPGVSQAVARDFDNDGDLDIAAISFFPDYKTRPEQNFVYFENTGNLQFKASVVPETIRGRWLVMEAGDYDNDNDIDIFLGAFNFNEVGNEVLFGRRQFNSDAVLILKNTLY
ncbi:FG-GAP repeat domain-containing protein [Chryseosolibacter indicus]|uniref:VCBS repeat-containing protein n=1 Tax=Chryseosolibacter indicus TaxID=2782351 RepID=A0ABS5VSY6_9BACT|nr:VCBS repeat-containing protein [Chryseosolibacter indicus]MBT1704547.1 VCBS repeat-containing protein [Chryseosolibacter indicus]